MKKLNAEVDLLKTGWWKVKVTNVETGDVAYITLEAENERDAAFKAMEQVNDQ